ncbi:MAG: hypothetical protein DME76_08410 [Verrucomicrobia bacterium]|nr:MAG: hypothetical protein DME76_08410 [Verrucomicrobiota bacterium]
MLGIDVVNNAVVGGRLTPALVAPVATAIGKHAGEVAYGSDTRTGKAGAGVGVGPSVAAVGGPEDEVGVVVGEATASFVHASDVYVASGQVAGDLDIADEGSAGGYLSRVGPGETVVSGIADEEGASADIEVVPGNVHSPVEGRGCVVIGPARLSVVVIVRVNTIMGPAIRVRRGSGLVAAQTLSAATPIEPDGIPGARWAIV